MGETWRQKELRSAGWVNNGELGRKQKWRWPKHFWLPLRDWHTTGEAIKAYRKYLRWIKDLK